ncbi:uncharacterized protein LOC141615393 [Silene latifolia]|uniref:uncharacterized protein LOC141615393 n=1 Tax=Silene latifolia TaxID=37657 RepID=UPI003D76CD37
MFPFMNNSYPLYYNQSPSFATPENNNNSFQHHQDLYSDYYLMPSNIIPPNSENPVIDTLLSEAPNYPFSSMNKQNSSKKTNGKKDRSASRHTKICTAQGVRDRRVRLSIDIAREFFNLQDMLGFDKASKTLGWLMEKSKDAIGELTMTINKSNETNIDDRIIEEKDEDEDYQDEEHEEQVLNTKGSFTKCGKKKKCVDQRPQNDEKAIRRTNRAMARERARERTKTKKTINDHNGYLHLESSIHHQNDQQQGVDEQNMLMNKGISVGESIVVKSNSKETTLNYYNYDMITKDNYPLGYYNYYNDDQLEKFEIGSLSSLNVINLSTEIHINTNSWDK